jgi:hypothetical protein
VSNVPAVMLYLPVLKAHPVGDQLWLLLAMASTLAGNLTLIGSVANLIVLEATRDDVTIWFVECLKVGFPVSVLTLIAGIAVLAASRLQTSSPCRVRSRSVPRPFVEGRCQAMKAEIGARTSLEDR